MKLTFKIQMIKAKRANNSPQEERTQTHLKEWEITRTRSA